MNASPERSENAGTALAGRWITIAAITALVAVALGAFAAHGLKGKLSAEQLTSFRVGVRYQMYHALAMLSIGWLQTRHPTRIVAAAGTCFILGVLLFSGSIYGLVLTSCKWLGPVTPIGGVILMVGWLLLAIAGLRYPRSGSRRPSPPDQS